MANPTTNFNWQMPTSSDLVTDLPADFEVFGQAVDTSLADLKGGTTGQVLSKASNTNMDFTWVTSDDANAIQNTIVDAKGDLIGATAADTPARLAVGTNGQVLTADSTAATGLAWATPAGSGLVHLNTTTGSGVTSISIGSNASPLFSTTYDNYKIIIVCDSDDTASQVTFRLRANTTDLTSSVYNNQNVGGADTLAFAQRSLSATSGKVMDNHTTDYTNITEILLTNPFNSRNKAFVSNSMSTRNTLGALVNNGYVADTSSYNGITFLSPNNINNATIYVYGLAK